MVVHSETLDEFDNESLKKGMKLVEAILFVSGRYLDMKDIITFSDLNPIIIREIMEKLVEKFSSDDSAIQIISKGEHGREMWKMDVKQEFSGLVNRLAGGSSEFSKAEQETLAIIAYKQPMKQSIVIKIRGNKAYDHIKRFQELGLIKKKKQGHTYELTLREEFYDYFNLEKPEKNSNQNTLEKSD